MQLKNSAAIVSGGASGVGAATAQALSAAGAEVYVLDVNPPVAPLAECTYLTVDVSDSSMVTETMSHVAEVAAPLRTVVNCAGIAPSERILGRKGVHDLALFARVVQINLMGTFNVMATATSFMACTEPDEHGQRGVVINTASGAAFEGQIGQAAYASSKGGIVALTLTAARDLAQYGIRVNSIAPGLMDTPMVATFSQKVRDGLAASVPFPGRLSRPDEFADLVLALIRNDYMNGETVRMDGALRMAPR